MRLTIVSRIFAPEPSAASFRLRAIANSAASAGHEVTVLTSTKPPALKDVQAELEPGIDVRRAPVLRDRAGYVRGYLQYLSFDAPLVGRLLFGRRPDHVLVEPPPTTGVVARLVCAVRRVPYSYYAADVWSDAASMTGAPRLVIAAVRAMEKFAMRGALRLLSVSHGVTERLAEWGIDDRDRIITIGNGIDLKQFRFQGERVDLGAPYFLYAGTASEVHGALIFVEAFARVVSSRPDARLIFIGQGSEWEAIGEMAKTLPAGSVQLKPRMEPEEVAAWLRGAQASLASVRTGGGYDFAFPTKMYASVGCGTPVIYAGPGPARQFIEDSGAGEAVAYDVDAIAAALARRLNVSAMEPVRRDLADWAKENVDIDAVAARAVALLSSEKNAS